MKTIMSIVVLCIIVCNVCCAYDQLITIGTKVYVYEHNGAGIVTSNIMLKNDRFCNVRLEKTGESHWINYNDLKIIKTNIKPLAKTSSNGPNVFSFDGKYKNGGPRIYNDGRIYLKEIADEMRGNI